MTQIKWETENKNQNNNNRNSLPTITPQISQVYKPGYSWKGIFKIILAILFIIAVIAGLTFFVYKVLFWQKDKGTYSKKKNKNHFYCSFEFTDQITKKDPKSDARLSEFDWHDLSPFFGHNPSS